MSDVDTLFTDQDTPAPVNPFADARVKAQFTRPTDGAAKWLAEHPDEAQKAEGYEQVTFRLFGPDHEVTKMVANNYKPVSVIQPTAQRRIETREPAHDYETIHRVHCTKIHLTQEWGFQYWELWTDDGPVGIHARDDKDMLAKAVLVYPLLTMQPQDRVTVDFDLTYQWQRGAGSRAGRRKLLEIIPKEMMTMPDKSEVIEKVEAADQGEPEPQKRSEITKDKETTVAFVKLVSKIANRYEVPTSGRDDFFHKLLEVQSYHDWHGSFFSAVSRIHCGILDAYLKKDEFKKEIVELFKVGNVILDYEAAVGEPSLDASLEAGKKPSEIWLAVERYVDEHKTDIPEKASDKPATASNAPTGSTPQTEPNAGHDVPQSVPGNGNAAAAEKPAEQIIDKAQFRKERTIKIQGQDYLKAGDRVVMFRADHPDWTLETEVVQLLPDFAVFKARVKDSMGKTVSTAHGYCTPDLAKKVSGRFVEKAETAAIARALALAGYGTDDTLDDGDYLSDSPITKAA